ncbi:hypothetical protein D3C80_1742260 [compost metagenome]
MGFGFVMGNAVLICQKLSGSCKYSVPDVGSLVKLTGKPEMGFVLHRITNRCGNFIPLSNCDLRRGTRNLLSD